METPVAIITGAGRGIGRECALRLAAEGFNLVLNARTQEQLSATACDCGTSGVQVVVTPGDIRDTQVIHDLFRACDTHFGPPTVVINNAGVARFSPVSDTTDEQLDEMLAVNIRAPFLICREALRRMRLHGKGCIINVVSTAAHIPYPNQAAYVASKHALLGLTRVLAREAREHGIRVCAVSPGGVDTQMAAESHPTRDKSGWITPAQVADTVVWLSRLPDNIAVDELIVRRFEADPL